MSERFPVSTQVQVKNEGHGSSFRTEAERVGEFTGTVVATSGPDYTGIPEVCVESATGERRVILVGDLEETPEPVKHPTMKAKLKIWYASGGYQEIQGSSDDSMQLAAIYAEAADSGRVSDAELHRPDGSVAASFHHDTA